MSVVHPHRSSLRQPRQSVARIFLIASVVLVACTSRTTLEPGSRTPATHAVVVAEQIRSKHVGNLEFEVEVEHLPPPAELGDGLSTFVVWLTPHGGEQPQNIGELDYDPSARTGSLETVTPYRQFRIAVTAESMPNPLRPNDLIVAQGEVEFQR